jgi:hypothetical protein
MPNTTAGDAIFAAAAASAIFGSAATVNTPIAIQTWATNRKAFYTTNGVVGVPNATADQIDLAALGAAWGDAVGVALANNLGLLPGQVANFLGSAAQGTAVYSASLSSQPIAAPFQGAPTAPPDFGVQLVGVGLNSIMFNLVSEPRQGTAARRPRAPRASLNDQSAGAGASLSTLTKPFSAMPGSINRAFCETR